MDNENRFTLSLRPNTISFPSVLKSPAHRPSAQTKAFHCYYFENHLIEYMETSFSRIPHDNTRFLQKEVGDFPSIWFSTGAELDLKVFPLMDQSIFFLLLNWAAMEYEAIAIRQNLAWGVIISGTWLFWIITPSPPAAASLYFLHAGIDGTVKSAATPSKFSNSLLICVWWETYPQLLSLSCLLSTPNLLQETWLVWWSVSRSAVGQAWSQLTCGTESTANK